MSSNLFKDGLPCLGVGGGLDPVQILLSYHLHAAVKETSGVSLPQRQAALILGLSSMKGRLALLVCL